LLAGWLALFAFLLFCFLFFLLGCVGGKNIYMCSLLDVDNPIELAFMVRTAQQPCPLPAPRFALVPSLS
jgi:hypothetical protein